MDGKIAKHTMQLHLHSLVGFTAKVLAAETRQKLSGCMGEERPEIVLEPLLYKVRIFQLLWSKLVDSDLREYIKHKSYGWTLGQESLLTERQSLHEVIQRQTFSHFVYSLASVYRYQTALWI